MRISVAKFLAYMANYRPRTPATYRPIPQKVRYISDASCELDKDGVRVPRPIVYQGTRLLTAGHPRKTYQNMKRNHTRGIK